MADLLEIPSIHSLDDYCMIEIFSHLSFIERVTAALVCKRWWEINTDLHRLTRVNLIFLGLKSEDIGILLGLRGKFLINLRGKVSPAWDILPSLMRHCGNLESLTLRLVNNPELHSKLTGLLMQNQKLKTIEIKGIADNFETSYLQSLPENTTSVSIASVSLHQQFKLKRSHIRHFKNLRSLTLKFVTLDGEAMATIYSRNTLTHLTLFYCIIPNGIVDRILQFENLEYLNLVGTMCFGRDKGYKWYEFYEYQEFIGLATRRVRTFFYLRGATRHR